VFPAIDVSKSGTRKEELLLPPPVLNKVWILRKFLDEKPTVEAMEFMIDKLSKTSSNKKFLDSMNTPGG